MPRPSFSLSFPLLSVGNVVQGSLDEVARSHSMRPLSYPIYLAAHSYFFTVATISMHAILYIVELLVLVIMLAMVILGADNLLISHQILGYKQVIREIPCSRCS